MLARLGAVTQQAAGVALGAVAGLYGCGVLWMAGLLDPALRMPSAPGARRSVAQKWDQGLAAVELEKRWHKPEIFEAYLNLAPFRGDFEGLLFSGFGGFANPP